MSTIKENIKKFVEFVKFASGPFMDGDEILESYEKEYSKRILTRTMYVLRREDGKFYWKNQSTSSAHGWEEGFEKAFLFSTRRGAESRMFISHDMKCEVKEVTVSLIDDKK